jgi:AcrR family transcriptional regulator
VLTHVNVNDPRERILAEARDLYLAEGIEGLSMRKIGARIGVSATALYRHFKNKEELVGEILLDGVKMFARYLDDALRGQSAGERLTLAAEAFLRFGLEQPKHYEVFFLKRQPTAGLLVAEELENQRRATFRFLMDRVQECMEAGLLRKDKVSDVALLLLGQSQGMVSMHLMKKMKFTDQDFIAAYRAAVGRLLVGLGGSAATFSWVAKSTGASRS